MEARGRTAVYRFYDSADQLLYVGIADDPRKRWLQHSMGQPWWHTVAIREVEWMPDRQAAVDAESEAIRTERPRYNGYRSDDGWVVRERYDNSSEITRIADSLRERIRSGDLPAGTRLMYLHLAAEYGVSAVTVSCAVGSLPKGLIDWQGNRRYVASTEQHTSPATKPAVLAISYEAG